MAKQIIFFFLLVITSKMSWAQNTTKGRVLDASNSQPLIGANISSPEGTFGTQTDQLGLFELSLTTAVENLIVSHVGYKSQSIVLKQSQTAYTVLLEVNDFYLSDVVVSAYPTQHTLMKAPGATTILTKRDLQRENEVIITPALNRVPGIYMHSGTLSTNRITVRGIGSRSLFSTNKIKAYLDEIPLSTGEGETTIEDLDLSLIDRVEVIKGPASSIYGAGLGGTINLSTIKGNRGISNHFSTGGSVASYGLFRTQSQLGLQGDNVGFKVIFNTMHSDGYRDNNEYDRQSGTLLGQFYPGKSHVITSIVNFIHLKGFIPSSLDSATFSSNPRAAAANWEQARGFEEYDKSLIGLSWRSSPLVNLHQSTSVFTGFRDANEPRPFNILKENSDQLGVRSKLEWDLKVPWEPVITTGGEFFVEWFNWSTFENDNRQIGPVLSINQEIRKYLNIYSELKVSVSTRTQIMAGININHTQYNLEDLFVGDSIDQTGDYSFDVIVSPRLAFNHQINDWAIYGNISHGFSPPSLSETLTPDGQINTDIQPETGYNFEIGARGNLLNNRLFFDGSLYTMRIKDLLVAERIGQDQFVGVNAGRTTHNGLEISVIYKIIQDVNAPLNFWQVQVTHTLADYEFSDFINNDQDFSGNQLTGTPSNLFNLISDFGTAWNIYGNFNFQWVDEIPITDDNSIFSNSYSLVNLKIGYKTMLGTKLTFNLFGGINNLFDEKYASMLLINASSFGGASPRYFYPGLPRNYYSGLSIKYLLN